MRTRLRLSLTIQELAPAARQGGLAYLDQVPVGVTDVAADLGLVLFRRREELGTSCAPLRIHSVDVRDRMLRKLLASPGSCGVSSVTAGLSSVGPPPTLMMIQLLASATYVGSPEWMAWPPSTSV